MGSAGSSLPHRVNIIYGGRFALVKTGRGDCPVDMLEVTALFQTASMRRSTSAKWHLKVQEDALDEHRRPLLCLIRNDRHPQRSLRAGEPIMVDDCKWTSEHCWLLEYENRSTGSDETVGPPFHICNLATRRYLAVDEAIGKAVMQNFRPSVTWELLDAGAQCTATTTAAATAAAAAAAADSSSVAPAGQSFAALSSSSISDPVADSCGLKQLHGPMAQALSVYTHTQGGRAFTVLEEFVRDGRPLGEELTLAEPNSMLPGIWEVLYGPNNYFRRDLAEAEDAELSPIALVEGSPWCGWASVKQTCHVAVLGKRPYEEELRVALCRTNDEGVKLAVQMACSLKIGLHVGDFKTEVLHIFSQRAKGDPVRLRSFGIAQPGRQQQRALDGMREGRAKYVRKARMALREAPHALLKLQAEEVELEGSEWKAKDLNGVPSSERPVPRNRMESLESCATDSKSEETKRLRSPITSWAIPRAVSGFVPSWSGASFMKDQHCFSGLGALRRSGHVRSGHLQQTRWWRRSLSMSD